jgi:endo-1,4-beta-xylanase
MTIDPCRPLEYLFQGNDSAARVDDYIKIAYRVGVITAEGEIQSAQTVVDPAPHPAGIRSGHGDF